MQCLSILVACALDGAAGSSEQHVCEARAPPGGHRRRRTARVHRDRRTKGRAHLGGSTAKTPMLFHPPERNYCDRRGENQRTSHSATAAGCLAGSSMQQTALRWCPRRSDTHLLARRSRGGQEQPSAPPAGREAQPTKAAPPPPHSDPAAAKRDPVRRVTAHSLRHGPRLCRLGARDAAARAVNHVPSAHGLRWPDRGASVGRQAGQQATAGSPATQPARRRQTARGTCLNSSTSQNK